MPLNNFALSKPRVSDGIFQLADYVQNGGLSFSQSEFLRTAIVERRNILVVGGTGSGKTTFCNALLNEFSTLVPDFRMLLLEDTRELQCTLSNRCFLKVEEVADMVGLLMATSHFRPDSITVGEVRSGGLALALLQFWNTGHPGGMATVHANSASKGLTRMDQLIQEVSANPQRVLIGEAVNVVVFLERFQGSCQVKEIMRVREYDPAGQKFVVEAVK